MEPAIVRVLLEHGQGRLWVHELHTLLASLALEGSLNRAARAAGIPYRRAWQIIRDAAELSGSPLTSPQTGGPSGGGSLLTPHGQRLLTRLGGVLDDTSHRFTTLLRHEREPVPGAADHPWAPAAPAAPTAPAEPAAEPRGTARPEAAGAPRDTARPEAGGALRAAARSAAALPDAPHLILATSAEPAECGMLDALEEAFRDESGLVVRHLVAGSSAALSLLAAGKADLALTHAPRLEAELVAAGWIAGMQRIMESDYVVALPARAARGDGLHDGTCESVFRQIARERIPFVSRADRSGTHLRELELWERSRVHPEQPWYLPAQRVGARGTLRLAEERSAATLVDRLVLGPGGGFRVIRVACEEATNVFSLALPANEGAVMEAAHRFRSWLAGDRAREVIASYGARPARNPRPA